MDIGEKLQKCDTSLIGFAGGSIEPIGSIRFVVSLGDEPQRRTEMIDFLVVDAPSAYNVLLGRSALHKFKAIASTVHLKIKFPCGQDIGVVHGDQLDSRKLYVQSVKLGGRIDTGREKKKEKIAPMEEEPVGRLRPREETMMVELSLTEKGKTMSIGETPPLDVLEECG